MKKLAIASLIGFTIPVFVASFSFAQGNPVTVPILQSRVGPIDLVNLAYQGFLEEQGIPKFNRLTDGYLFGQITAEDLVQAGVDAGRVSASATDDSGYLRQVDLYLQSLSRDQDNS